MTNPITIPPAALRAARAASMNALGDGEDAVLAACLAMLEAWPRMREDVLGEWEMTGANLADVVEYNAIILPLTESVNDT
jgi:hypothetical protein